MTSPDAPGFKTMLDDAPVEERVILVSPTIASPVDKTILLPPVVLPQVIVFCKFVIPHLAIIALNDFEFVKVDDDAILL